MTEAMKDIVVKIMAEVIEILGLVTKDVKRGRTSESTTDDMCPPVADKKLEKYLRRLVGRTDIQDALRRLDRLTQEEARMLSVQVLHVAHVGTRETVNSQVAYVNDVALKGAFSTLATHTCHRKHPP